MTRPKSSKSNHKLVEESVIFVSGSAPSSPTTRKKHTEVAVVSDAPKKSKKHRPSKSTSEVDTDDDDNVALEKAEKAEKAKAAKMSSATRKEIDRSLRKVKRAVDELSDSFAATPHWPMPGALFQNLNKKQVLQVLTVISFATTLISHVLPHTVSGLWPEAATTWNAPRQVPGIVPILSIRILKMAVSYGPINTVPNLVALNVLCYSPMVYLLTSFYNVPLSALVLSEVAGFIIEFLASCTCTYIYKKAADEALIENEDETLNYVDTVQLDWTSFYSTSVFAAALYGFTFVQACRLFLPSMLVVHFFDIATVEPARAHPFPNWNAFTATDLFLAVFQSVPALVLNLACGIAARIFVFNYNYIPDGLSPDTVHSAALHRRIIAVRSLTVSGIVGLSVFLNCFLSIQGVDAVGSAAYASIWAVAPLLVGAGLCYTGL